MMLLSVEGLSFLSSAPTACRKPDRMLCSKPPPLLSLLLLEVSPPAAALDFFLRLRTRGCATGAKGMRMPCRGKPAPQASSLPAQSLGDEPAQRRIERQSQGELAPAGAHLRPRLAQDVDQLRA